MEQHLAVRLWCRPVLGLGIACALWALAVFLDYLLKFDSRVTLSMAVLYYKNQPVFEVAFRLRLVFK